MHDTQDMQKVTVHLPRDLLETAKTCSGKGATEILRDSLRDYVARLAGQKLAEMRGKLHLDIDLEALREDRDLSRFQRSD